jgi:hypothetical protein
MAPTPESVTPPPPYSWIQHRNFAQIEHRGETSRRTVRVDATDPRKDIIGRSFGFSPVNILVVTAPINAAVAM